MAARRRRLCWSARNDAWWWKDTWRRHLALREMPDGIFPAAAALRALPWRGVRAGPGLRGARGGDFGHPPHAGADRLAAAPHRQRAHLRRPAYHGWAHRRLRTRRRDRALRG